MTSLIVVIPVLTASIIAIIGSIFTGILTLKTKAVVTQVKEVALPEIHTAVNTNYQEMQKQLKEAKDELAAGRQDMAAFQAQQLGKAELRAEAVVPPATPQPPTPPGG